jgi:hypothetical protein
LAREVHHRIVGDFMEPAREPSTPEQELEQHGKPEPDRAGLVAQLIQLVADQREMVDDVIEAQAAGPSSTAERVLRHARDQARPISLPSHRKRSSRSWTSLGIPTDRLSHNSDLAPVA